MLKIFKSFCKDDSGAVTVDWVVLTAVVGLMATILVLSVRDGSVDQAKVISDIVESQPVRP